MTAAAYVVASALFTTGGVLLLRRALMDMDELTPSTVRAVLLEPGFVIGFVLYALSFLTWLFALRRYQATAIYPAFVGAGYAGVVLGGYFFLGESLTASKAIGVVVILLGIGLIAR